MPLRIRSGPVQALPRPARGMRRRSADSSFFVHLGRQGERSGDLVGQSSGTPGCRERVALSLGEAARATFSSDNSMRDASRRRATAWVTYGGPTGKITLICMLRPR